MKPELRFKRWVLGLGLALLAGPLAAGPTRNSTFGAGLALDTSLWPFFTNAGASLTGKMWFDGVNAMDMSLGGGSGGIGLAGTYLWHSARAFNRRDIPVYYGLGAYLGLGNNQFSAGAQAKIGVTWLFPGTPWDVFVEGVPRLNLLGGIGFGAGLSGGFRYYF